MDLETLRAINFAAAIVLPMWVIGPLMRSGMRYWVGLGAVFLFVLGSRYLELSCSYPPESAFLRSLGLALMLMLFGYVWAITVSKYKRDQVAQERARAQP